MNALENFTRYPRLVASPWVSNEERGVAVAAEITQLAEDMLKKLTEAANEPTKVHFNCFVRRWEPEMFEQITRLAEIARLEDERGTVEPEDPEREHRDPTWIATLLGSRGLSEDDQELYEHAIRLDIRARPFRDAIANVPVGCRTKDARDAQMKAVEAGRLGSFCAFLLYNAAHGFVAVDAPGVPIAIELYADYARDELAYLQLALEFSREKKTA